MKFERKKRFSVLINPRSVPGENNWRKLTQIREVFSSELISLTSVTLRAYKGVGKLIKIGFSDPLEKEKIEALAEYHKIDMVTNLESHKTDFQKAAANNIDRANEIIVTHIPIDTSDVAIKAALGKFGDIQALKTTIKSQWKIANIIYQKATDAEEAGNNWHTYILKDSVRLYHANKYTQEIEQRSEYTLKLTHLKSNTTSLDL